ncbi:glycosyltransferase family 4 protein [Spectribacter hydrogenoxidans]|uniref:Glycosyltransferase family 4 protein n=1 Tax=Spectribacter hydrogenoxidans TaxID=3075608 RepID=A0ABU3C468_9GAMM|nr:glycosyltransferase family 4 protein [Salinisphaera sp. W335]MDT0636359.1 glycosyltransferase family 4 protein [Salinisphaera sp. W335]
MRHLWVLNHYGQIPGSAGGSRHYSLAKHLVRHGWETTVIAASTDHKSGRQRNQETGKRAIEEYDGFRFVWVRTPDYRGNGLGRIRNMLSYTWRALAPGTTRDLPKPDAVIGSSVHPLAAWAGARLAERHGVPFLFEVRDLWPQTLIDMGRISANGVVARALGKLELSLYEKADRILVLLPHADRYIAPLGIPEKKIEWLPNGVELEGYPKPQPPSEDGRFTLMYFGAHGQANGLDNILRAMALVEQRADMQHVRLRMIGDGPLKLALHELAHELGLRRVHFEEAVPKAEIPRLASEADAFIVNLISVPTLYCYGISLNKIFDYMAASRPIIFGGTSSNNPIEDSGAGISVPPADPRALANAIVKIVNMGAEERKPMGAAGRAYVTKNHAFKSLAEKLARILDEVVASPDSSAASRRASSAAASGKRNELPIL